MLPFKVRRLLVPIILIAPLAVASNGVAQAQYARNPNKPGVLAHKFEPLTNTEKFRFRVLNTLALRGIVGAAFGAGFNQVIDSPHEWGGGVEGYSERYASAFGGALVRQSLNFGFESLLNEDPRYFPLGGSSKKARLLYALKETFFTRTDSGGDSFAYGRVASAFATGQITRTWLPSSSNTVADGVRTGFVSLGIDAAVNVLYEFYPHSRPKAIRER